jgi:hypothetical protein
LLDLPAQPRQFFPLGRAQAFLARQGMARITGGLAYPIQDSLRSDPELSGELGRRSASANQFNYVLAKFSRIGRMCLGHVDSLKANIKCPRKRVNSRNAGRWRAWWITLSRTAATKPYFGIRVITLRYALIAITHTSND